MCGRRFGRLWMVFILLGLFACSPADKRADLSYDRTVNAKGGLGELFIAKPSVKFDASRNASGDLVIGIIKGTGRDVVTRDDVSDWLMRAFSEELNAAGYRVTEVQKLPGEVSKGLAISVSKLSADQTPETLTISTVSNMKVGAEVWRDGKLVKILTVTADSEEKGIDRSAEPITNVLKRALQDIMRRLVPDIISTLEQRSPGGS